MAVEAVLSVLIQKLTDMLIQESIIFNKVIDEVESVRIELRQMQRSLKHAEDHKQESDETSEEVKKWVANFLDTVYEVEDVIESFVLGTTRLRRMGFVKKYVYTVNELKASQNLRREMGRIKSNITKLNPKELDWARKTGVEFDVVPAGSSFPDEGPDQHRKRISRYSAEEESVIVGFKEDVKTLVTQLTNVYVDQRGVISIIGVGGSGKTTLAETIYNDKEIMTHFECRAWVSVSREFTMRNLLLSIIKQIIGLKEEKRLTNDQLTRRLQECVKEKRYLIVMDDVRTPDTWKELQGALPDTSNGSRVMLTTRNRDVAMSADPEWPPHQLNRLSDRNSWELFVNKARLSKDDQESPDSEVFQSLQKKILTMCGGSPLAIVVIGGLLSTKQVGYEEWLRVLGHAGGQLDESETEFLLTDILALSYNDLPFHLRPCFLYFGLFPREFDVPIRRLLRLWLAEGFVKQSPGMTSEDLVEGYLEDLVDRNMIQVARRGSDGSPKTCRMPGVLHDVFLPKAEDIGLFHVHRISDYRSVADPPFGVRRVVEYVDIKNYPHTEPYTQHLRSYLSFNGQKNDTPAAEIGSFLGRIIGGRGFGLLRVLDLEGIYKPQLPEELGNLFHLRYLGLRWTFLDTLPSSVSDLPYLETLDVKHTYISTLPSSIWKMKHLRHLCLNETRLDMSVQRAKSTSPLTQLQTLWGLFVDRKSPVKKGLNRLINLRKLGLTCHSTSVEELGEWIARMGSLQSLRLRSKDQMGRPSKLSLEPLSSLENLSHLYLLGNLPKLLEKYEFPPRLRVLTLSVSKLEQDPMPTLSKLPSLSVLRLFADSYIGKEMVCPFGGFSTLQVLKLWKLEQLEEWTVKEEAMQNLRELEIRCCGRLNNLPDRLLEMGTIKKLTLTNMPKKFVAHTQDKKHDTTFVIVNNWKF